MNDQSHQETADSTGVTSDDWPGVSVVMPVRNESEHLGEAVRMVLAQDYPGELEVVLAVGPSHDGTEQIAAHLVETDHRIRLVRNPDGITPAALNKAIDASRNKVIVRVDGHGELSQGYIRRAVEILQKSAADNVGGIMDAQGRTAFEQAIARGMTSRLGIGGARFHLGGEAGPADSVYLGVFRRDTLVRLGGFDEHFKRAQDWELNYRIRRSGGLVWFSPDLRVTYRPRSSWRDLATQFYRTGRWRREVIRRYPETASFRYLAAPIAVSVVALGAVVGLVGLLGGPDVLMTGWLIPALYGLGIVAGSLIDGDALPLRARLWLPAVLTTMHMCWGAGFLRGPERSG